RIIAAKPEVMPSMCGTARRKPKFAVEAMTITTFGPGVRHVAAANSTSGPSSSGMTTPHHRTGQGARCEARANYVGDSRRRVAAWRARPGTVADLHLPGRSTDAAPSSASCRPNGLSLRVRSALALQETVPHEIDRRLDDAPGFLPRRRRRHL